MDKGNEAAFPSHESWMENGLTKREYFAGLAMQGILASKWYADHVKDFGDTTQASCAKASVTIADVLIAELSKE